MNRGAGGEAEPGSPGRRNERKNSMKVLDLDMDFFLTGPCPLAAPGERPDPSCAAPYSNEKVIDFLERQCGLSRSHPLPGAIFDTHDKALDFWRARMQEGLLSAPFDVVHVDTHSDLAFGPPGTDFVLRAVLSRRPDARPAIENYRVGRKLDEANYLLFALAFRWIRRLVYVRNPRSRQDVPGWILDGEGSILLRSDVSALMEKANGREPAIPFEVYDDYTVFCETGYDFVTMAQSPRYAPAAADQIMDLLRPYIREM